MLRTNPHQSWERRLNTPVHPLARGRAGHSHRDRPSWREGAGWRSCPRWCPANIRQHVCWPRRPGTAIKLTEPHGSDCLICASPLPTLGQLHTAFSRREWFPNGGRPTPHPTDGRRLAPLGAHLGLIRGRDAAGVRRQLTRLRYSLPCWWLVRWCSSATIELGDHQHGAAVIAPQALSQLM